MKKTFLAAAISLALISNVAAQNLKCPICVGPKCSVAA